MEKHRVVEVGRPFLLVERKLSKGVEFVVIGLDLEASRIYLARPCEDRRSTASVPFEDGKFDEALNRLIPEGKGSTLAGARRLFRTVTAESKDFLNSFEPEKPTREGKK